MRTKVRWEEKKTMFVRMRKIKNTKTRRQILVTNNEMQGRILEKRGSTNRIFIVIAILLKYLFIQAKNNKR